MEPMKMKSGTAASTKLDAIASTFWTNWKITAVSKVTSPKKSATPIIENATGNPKNSASKSAGNIIRAR